MEEISSLSPNRHCDDSNDQNVIDVFIEIPYGDNVKYEIDKDTGRIRVDRVLSTSMVYYPGNYGYIPDTLADDGDPLDVLVINDRPFYPGSMVKCRVLGMLETRDEKGMDEKIIALPINKIDARYSNIRDLSDITKGKREMIKHFFENYKKLENGKFVEVVGYKDYKETLELIAIKKTYKD